MRIKFLGTSAAEGIPAVFCNCPACLNAKSSGGRDIRTRSQILIDGDTLFDFPMDTYMHMLSYGLDLSAIKRVLITHSHMDHCYPQEFCMRGEPFAKNLTTPEVEVYCNGAVRDMFIADTSREMRPAIAENIKIKTLRPFDDIISGDVRIIALPASHTPGEECLVYYVERAGKGVLLLNDTGPLDASVYERLRLAGASVAFAAFDCTYGAVRHGAGRHMGLYDVKEQVALIRSAGILNRDAALYVTHFSHNGGLSYAAMCELANAEGINVAYDGLECEV